jgi:hypothetical protein
MEPRPEVTEGWKAMARRGNLAQRQPRDRTLEQIDQILMDNLEAEAEALWEALKKDFPEEAARWLWYQAPHEALGNLTPSQEIAAGHYRRVRLALRPQFLNEDCKM